jgi:hypothetical protein
LEASGEQAHDFAKFAGFAKAKRLLGHGLKLQRHLLQDVWRVGANVETLKKATTLQPRSSMPGSRNFITEMDAAHDAAAFT